MNETKKKNSIIHRTLKKIPHKFIITQVTFILAVILCLVLFTKSMHDNKISAMNRSNAEKVTDFRNNLETSCDILDYKWYIVENDNEIETDIDDINKWCRARFTVYNRYIDGIYEISGEHKPLELITFEDNSELEKPYKDNISNFVSSYNKIRNELEVNNISNAVYITPQAKLDNVQYKYTVVAYVSSLNTLNDFLENENILDDNTSIIFTNSALEYSNIEDNFDKANILYIDKYYENTEHYRISDIHSNTVEFDKVFNKIALSEIKDYSRVVSDSTEKYFDITDDIWIITVTKTNGTYSNNVYVGAF